MTTAVDAQQHPLADPSVRGVTRISPIVVERIAAYACNSVPGAVTRDQFAYLERVPPVKVRAEVMGSTTHLVVSVGVEWPAPIVRIAHAVRTHVAAEVERMCGLSIVGVDVRPVPVVVRRATRVR